MQKIVRRTLACAGFAVALSVSTANASDSYLYWMVDTQDTDWGSFAVAALRAKRTPESNNESSEVLDLKRPDDYDLETYSGTYLNTVTSIDTSKYDGWTFVVELMSYNPETETYIDKGYLYSRSFADLVSSGSLSTDYMAPSGFAGNPANFGVVPEPTSGVMLLLGLAVLGLRRKAVA